MGYQESYLTIATEERFTQQRFDKLVKRVRELGRDYYDGYGTYPVEIITFNGANGFFKKGQKAIYFVGERWLQSNLSRLLRYGNEDDYPDKMWEKDPDIEYKLWKDFQECQKYHAQIIFTEYVEPEGVWSDAGKPLYVTHEEFKWEEDD